MAQENRISFIIPKADKPEIIVGIKVLTKTAFVFNCPDIESKAIHFKSL